MSSPHCPQNAPYAVELKQGETYAWCSCGHSVDQPFCDGSHKGTGLMPTVFTAEADETVYLCGCKRTKAGPRCDGSHIGG